MLVWKSLGSAALVLACVSLWTPPPGAAGLRQPPPPQDVDLYGPKEAVLKFTPANFNKLVLQTEHAVLVEFYAPWCGHCKALAPKYRVVAENLKGKVRVGGVNCDEQTNAKLCEKYEIAGFPTIKMFPGASSIPDKEGKFANFKVPQDYEGQRTAKDIENFAVKFIPSYVDLVSSKAVAGRKSIGIDAFMESTLPKALLFTQKTATSPLFKALSVDFHYTMLLGEVRRPATDLEKRFGVKKFPTLLAFAKGKTSPTVYDGAMDHPSLFAFLKKFARPASPPAAAKGATEGKAPERQKATAAETEPFDPSIPQIAKQEDLRASCLDARGICVLAFSVVEPEFDESLRVHNETLSTLSSVKRSLHSTGSMSQFRFYWIDALTEAQLADDFRLSDNRPTLMALNAHRSAYQPFTGAFDEEGIKRWLNDITSNKGRSFMYNFEVKMAAEAKKGAREMTTEEEGSAALKKEEL